MELQLPRSGLSAYSVLKLDLRVHVWIMNNIPVFIWYIFFLATKTETFAFNVINSLSWKRLIRKQKYLHSRGNLVFMAQRDNVGGSLG